ncbi:hypothetical protein SAMN05878482_103479 [Peribacillus simplex]|uniref:Uncharacterized protein n=1 Tax=Peribacillus simplex TaxID=1478 RepID=A0A9X8WKU7_9BACI|nr:hypothetical protein [Peribacillus simplex]SIR37973.1 hypothetical protein SAMN05878482_103479 [Peribacillus simplex]
MEHLKTWKQELEKANEEHQSSLENFINEREMLQSKKTILQEIIFHFSGEKAIEDFKIQSGYNEITSSLKNLESQEQYELEEKLKIKIHYNKHIIGKINLELPVQ